MNNSNGAALLARIRHGSAVTIRLENGAQLVGRAAYSDCRACWQVHGRDGVPYEVTSANVTRVQS